MPKVKTTLPVPSRQKGERNIDLPTAYLNRWLPAWSQPEWWEAETWRLVVANQPLAVTCRETLIANIEALEWKIEPRDSTMRDEYKLDIDYYTRFFQDTGDYDYSTIIEWTGKDLLDIPFGTAVELGWEGDTPPTEGNDNKLLWIELLDGSSLFPTFNSDWPVAQTIRYLPDNTVVFPKHAINRIYMSPRTELKRKGWGMAPPEKIYLALSLLGRGDVYYANLLLDTPETGILDLQDMSKDSAETWLESWKNLLGGIDPFKIPILYEHTKPAVFIPFNRSPTELLFDRTILRYASLVAAGYGMTLSDIGLQSTSSGGETLAGAIRNERRTRKTGFAQLKRKYIHFFNRMLPPWLEFKFIDLDEELNVAVGRARLANATAMGQLIDRSVITSDESRQQLIRDGLISISIPELFPEGDQTNTPPAKPTPERPGMLGKPIAPSQGGYGEVLPKSEVTKSQKIDYLMETDDMFRKAMSILEEKWDSGEFTKEQQNEFLDEINNYLDAVDIQAILDDN